MNQALPGERVAAPARNSYLQNNSFSRSDLSANTLAGSPGTREEGGAGLGRGRLSTDLHSPPLSPTPALRDPEVAEAVPGTRAPLCCSRGTRSREAHSAGGSHGGARRTRRSRSRPGVRGGDKCQSRRPGARLHRPEDGDPSPARVLTARGVATRRAQRPLAARPREAPQPSPPLLLSASSQKPLSALLLRYSRGAANTLVSPFIPPRLPARSQSEAAPL